MSLNQTAVFVKHPGLTEDAFLGGRLSVFQPVKGFRAGLDSVLLGASVTNKCSTLLDLGAGAGVASLVALAHNPGLTALLAERDAEAAALAGANLVANGFAARAEVVVLDVTAPGPERVRAGLRPDHFGSVIANPPFFETGRGTLAQDAGRSAARHTGAGALDAWVRTAASCAAPGGEAIFIHVASALHELLAAFSVRFGAIDILPIQPRNGEPASRVMVRGIKGSRAPLQILPPLVLHGPDGGAFRPQIDAIFRGQSRLHWRSGD